jgi:hypothetical protein
MALDGRQYAASLAASFIPVADQIRDLAVGMGMRPYVVRIVTTRWTGRRPGVGVQVVLAEHTLEPVPLVIGLSSLREESVEGLGFSETGVIELSGVSGTYSEDLLRAVTPAELLGSDPSVETFYEVETLNLDGSAGDRRRFAIVGVPVWVPGQVGYYVRLERTQGDRNRDGTPGP